MVQEGESSGTGVRPTEFALQENEAMERALMESQLDSILLINPAGIVLDVNRKCAHDLGREVDELRGRCIFDFLPPAVRTHRQAKLDEVLRLQGPVRFDDERAGRSYDHYLYPIMGAAGEVSKIVIVARDITDRLGAEQERQFFSEVVASMAEGVVLISTTDEKILYANPTFELMFGYGPGEMAGMKVIDLNVLDGEGDQDINVRIGTALASTGVWHGEVKNIRKDGSLFWCSTNVKALHHFAFGKVWCAVQQDITERKQAEDKLKEIMDELEFLVAEKTSELQRKNIALSEVLHQIEVEKRGLEHKVDANIKTLLLPVVERLLQKSTSIDSRYLLLLKQNLGGLISSSGLTLSNPAYALTPKEIELCALIKGGFKVKEIASMQSLSARTVESHLYNIRKKLGISSGKAKLSSLLATM